MSELQIFDCTQGEDAWFACRAGIPTASEFSTILAKGRGGGESVTRRKYLYTLAAERIAGPSPFDCYSNGAMQRGHDYELEARDMYSLLTDNEVQQVGFMRRGDVGYSPDGLIGGDGLLEIKTKSYPLHLDCLLNDEVPSEHIAQVQGGLWVSGRQWLDFVSYSPGLPIFIKRVPRDESYIARLKVEVEQFNSELADLVERIKQYKRVA
jgi:hypothetical protein